MHWAVIKLEAAFTYKWLNINLKQKYFLKGIVFRYFWEVSVLATGRNLKVSRVGPLSKKFERHCSKFLGENGGEGIFQDSTWDKQEKLNGMPAFINIDGVWKP